MWGRQPGFQAMNAIVRSSAANMLQFVGNDLEFGLRATSVILAALAGAVIHANRPQALVVT
jgi:hypothetical protein